MKLNDPDEVKDVIELMSKLRYEMMTNKPISKIQDNGSLTTAQPALGLLEVAPFMIL